MVGNNTWGNRNSNLCLENHANCGILYKAQKLKIWPSYTIAKLNVQFVKNVRTIKNRLNKTPRYLKCDHHMYELVGFGLGYSYG